MEHLVGAKAFLSLDRAGTFICRKDGREVKFLVYQGAEFCEYDLLYDNATKEENGVVFETDIKDRYEKKQFIDKAIHKLAYYDTIALMIDGQMQENQIFRQQDFQWSDNYKGGELHICLKDVFYEINWSKLGIPKIDVPIALRFGLGDGLVVTPPRDSLIYDKEVKEIIIKKIGKVADWFQEKYDKEVKEFDNFVEALPHLRQTHKFVTLEENEITIDPLEGYMTKGCKEIQVKGLKLRNARHYFVYLDNMCRNFRTIGSLKWNGQYQSKNIWGGLDYIIKQGNYKGILVEQHPVGKVKEFLKEKYKRNTYFFVEPPPSLEFYKQALTLNREKKEKWRALIQECQEFHKQIRERFLLDERGVKGTKEFEDFVEEQRRKAKADKAAGIETSYKILDKQEGEVTIAYAREPLVGLDPVFEKQTYEIEGMKKQPYISLLFNEEDKEEAAIYYGLHKNLKTGLVGKRERTKLPKTHQIMNKEEFQKTKLFKRIVTAIRAHKAINRWESIIAGGHDIVEDCLSKTKKLREKLELYIRENRVDMRLKEPEKESLLLLAKEYSLWDQEILPDIEKMEKSLETFYFLQYLEYPRYATEEDKRRVKKIINQLLIYQKKHGALDNYELIEKPLPDEMMQEQSELEEEFMESEEAKLAFA